MKLNISSLSKLDCVEHTDGCLYIPIDSLFDTLKESQKSTDKRLRKDTFKETYKGNIILHDSIGYIELSALIGFCYANRQKQSLSMKVCAQIFIYKGKRFL